VSDSDRHSCLWASTTCAGGTVEDGEAVAAKTAKPDTICESCERSVVRVVEDSPEMWVSLELAIGDRSRRIGERVGGTPSPRINLNVAVEDVQGRLVEALVLAAARVSESLGVDDPQLKSRANAEQARVVQACTRLLRPHIGKLLDSPSDATVQWRRTGESHHWVDKSGIDLAADLVRVHRDGRRELGATTPRFRLSMPCPQCASVSLFRRVDKTDDGVRDSVTCDACGISWSHDSYLRLVSIFLEDEQERQAEEEKVANQELEARAAAAEAKAAELDEKLSAVRRLTLLQPEDAAAFDSITFISFLKDALGEAA